MNEETERRTRRGFLTALLLGGAVLAAQPLSAEASTDPVLDGGHP